jgi:hypothetical protein
MSDVADIVFSLSVPTLALRVLKRGLIILFYTILFWSLEYR